ncbi:MAG: response regulator [Rhodospirillales bacterium]|nr:response regulator [Rhodospirillales bacterium]
MTPAQVIVVDDDEAVCEALAALLKSAGFRTTTFKSGAAFLDSVTDSDAACVVLDIKMPGIDGLEVQRQLAQRELTIPVIVVTAYGDVTVAVRAMRAGAIDFIEKPVARDRLIESVERAIEAGTDLRRHLDERLEIDRRIDTLTPREREVFEQLVMGRPNKIAAYELGISPRTVEIYRKNVMTKMDASSLSHLVRMAIVSGIDPLAK